MSHRGEIGYLWWGRLVRQKAGRDLAAPRSSSSSWRRVRQRPKLLFPAAPRVLGVSVEMFCALTVRQPLENRVPLCSCPGHPVQTELSTATQEEPPWLCSLLSIRGESAEGRGAGGKAQMNPKGRKSPSRNTEEGAPLSRKENPRPNLQSRGMEKSHGEPPHASIPAQG